MLKKVLILFAVLLILSPFLLVFFGREYEHKLSFFNDILERVHPGFKPDTNSTIKIVQEPVIVNESQYSNLFEPGKEHILSMPAGFKVNVFRTNLGEAGFMAFDAQGQLYVSLVDRRQIVRLIDADDDGIAEDIKVFKDLLTAPRGIEFRDGWLYVSDSDRLLRIRDADGDGLAEEEEILDDTLPQGGNRSGALRFDPDGNLLISVSATCEACLESDDRRASILRYNDAGDSSIIARGVRKIGDFHYLPDGSLWATESERMGIDINDEINSITADSDYGWPYCFNDKTLYDSLPAPEDNYCANTVSPLVYLPGGSAPRGMAYIQDSRFPDYLQNKLLVVLYGSEDAALASRGFKVILIDPQNPGEKPVDCLYGWNLGGQKWGRPNYIITNNEGELFISDEYSGTVYRVIYEE
ncbi:MAG TPA: PQQ-dependent sugar dehydrogenase [bacterium]|nr:PQQ-dependent sugar dehydrogenase [bacterium]